MSSWEEVHDENGSLYYYNSLSGETSWNKPSDFPNRLEASSSSSQPLPQNWKEITDENGSIYYYNEVTFETSWSFPVHLASEIPSSPPHRSSSSSSALPNGWQEVTDESGNIYYYNANTNETAWDRPSETKTSISSSGSASSLPAGWQALVDENGSTYYYNEATTETSWEPPASGEKLMLDFSAINVTAEKKEKKEKKKDKRKKEIEK